MFDACLIADNQVIVCLLLWTSLFNLTISEFSQTLLQPLRAMVDDMKAVASLELVHIDADDPKRERTEKVADEIKNLQIAFLHMRTSIRSWTRYVPPAVVQRLFAAGIEARESTTRANFHEICKRHRKLLPLKEWDAPLFNRTGRHTVRERTI